MATISNTWNVQQLRGHLGGASIRLSRRNGRLEAWTGDTATKFDLVSANSFVWLLLQHQRTAPIARNRLRDQFERLGPRLHRCAFMATISASNAGVPQQLPTILERIPKIPECGLARRGLRYRRLG